MDWLLLFLLIPLTVFPIVLLCGFAGCDIVFGLHRDPPDPSVPPIPVPSNLIATALGVRRIQLSWTDNAMGTTGFTIVRTNPGTGESTSFSPQVTATSPPLPNFSYIDEDGVVFGGGLAEATEYEYQIGAVTAGGDSALSEPVTAKTLTWKTAFEQGPTAAQGTNPGNFAGNCMVQRISAANLLLGGPEVRLTLRGSTTINLKLDAITISQAKDQQVPLPPGPINLYDSAAANLPGGLTPVASNLLVPAGETEQIEVRYPLDKARDLLLAFDIGTPGNTRQLTPVAGGSLYRRGNTDEAGTPDRTAGYTTTANTVANIEKIEVAAPV